MVKTRVNHQITKHCVKCDHRKRVLRVPRGERGFFFPHGASFYRIASQCVAKHHKRTVLMIHKDPLVQEPYLVFGWKHCCASRNSFLRSVPGLATPSLPLKGLLLPLNSLLLPLN